MPAWRRARPAWRSRCARSPPTSSTYFHPHHESPMEASLTLTRRGVLTAALTLGAMQIFPGLSKGTSTPLGVRDLHRQLGGSAQGRAGTGVPEGDERRDGAGPDAVGG